ncbi:Sulfotransferase family protein [Micromonospora haikouensis]|uniref:Sulfotransferase family protein n=1 Tax=Micromonospora haikouensis TaxID=686309 RepID=A0A1C4XDV3_9ACTN|nr:hypothetical protein [Micromonospora haikouensis]SCF06645.1 Sulfotransferase family protein [Micromonospora haikouensis]
MTPRSCVVLGCARNGTSVSTAVIAGLTGHRLGPALLPPDQWNRGGYFESELVNAINDELLGRLPSVTPWVPAPRHRYLSAVPADQVAFGPAPEDMRHSMAELTGQHPFCLKDPRFCYTLTAWEPYLDDALRVCVFRDPESAARSLVRFGSEVSAVPIDREIALEIWRLAYASVLSQVSRGEWLFVDVDTFGATRTRKRLEAAIGAPLAWHLFDASRVGGEPGRGRADLPENTRELYDDLLARS